MESVGCICVSVLQLEIAAVTQSDGLSMRQRMCFCVTACWLMEGGKRGCPHTPRVPGCPFPVTEGNFAVLPCCIPGFTGCNAARASSRALSRFAVLHCGSSALPQHSHWGILQAQTPAQVLRVSGRWSLCRAESFGQTSVKWKSLNSTEIGSSEALFSLGEWIFLI